jgi:uncharacterized YigZ family protein
MEKDADAYWTLDGEGHAELKVKGSRFIGFACSIRTRDDAETQLEKIRKKYFDATHHCFAYRIGSKGQDFRASDGGEPSGTAGKSILDVIEGRGLTDVFCLVTRYFGGTKLGTGGLARAYGQCAVNTLEAARRIRKYVLDSFRLSFPYSLTGAVMPLLSLNDCRIVETRYGEYTELVIQVRRSLTETLGGQLQEATAGKIILCPVETGGDH